MNSVTWLDRCMGWRATRRRIPRRTIPEEVSDWSNDKKFGMNSRFIGYVNRRPPHRIWNAMHRTPRRLLSSLSAEFKSQLGGVGGKFGMNLRFDYFFDTMGPNSSESHGIELNKSQSIRRTVVLLNDFPHTAKLKTISQEIWEVLGFTRIQIQLESEDDHQ